jgi:hypothetical protein
MKKVIVLFSAALLLFTSCKNNETTEENLEIQEIKAEFIYLEDAAVLKGQNFIYGVKIDDMAKELANRVEPVKVEEFDMVPVVVKGVVTPKPENTEGWEQIVTIKEIVRVGTRPSQPDVKLE